MVRKAAVDMRNAYKTVIDHMPMPILVVDSDVKIHMYNTASQSLVPPDPELVYERKFGEALHCIHAEQGCGLGEQCGGCPIRSAVALSSKEMKVTRSQCALSLVSRQARKDLVLLVTASPITLEDGTLHVVVLEDITELVALKRLLPMCASCKSIRIAPERWEKIEEYLSETQSATFTHGLCPECQKELLAEIKQRQGARPD